MILSASGPAAVAEVAPANGEKLSKLTALQRPHRTLERSIAAFREQQRERRRGALNAAFVLGVPRSTLETIAACESGGDPTSVSADGSYRGKYQFDYGTWSSVGGSGDPAAASELEQDRRAAMLYSRGSSSPWPVCG